MTFTIRALATLVCGRNSIELIVKRLDFLSFYVSPPPELSQFLTLSSWIH